MEFSKVLEERWSPRQFSSRPVTPQVLKECFAAVRWAQSSFNEQPWRFLLTRREDGECRNKVEDCLAAGNAFAKEAWVLGISFAKRCYSHNGNANRMAAHDVGAINQALALKCFDLKVNTRFMAGFDVAKAQRLAPEEYEPMAMFALGYAAEETLAQGPGERSRRSVEELVFGGAWGSAFFSEA